MRFQILKFDNQILYFIINNQIPYKLGGNRSSQATAATGEEGRKAAGDGVGAVQEGESVSNVTGKCWIQCQWLGTARCGDASAGEEACRQPMTMAAWSMMAGSGSAMAEDCQIRHQRHVL